VTITRSHHPLAGKTLAALQIGRRVVVVRLADGSTMRVLREWTTAGGVAPAIVAGQDALFSIDDLRRLVVLVDALRQRS
jgi:hypothetical protein